MKRSKRSERRRGRRGSQQTGEDVMSRNRKGVGETAATWGDGWDLKWQRKQKDRGGREQQKDSWSEVEGAEFGTSKS